ncbi:MAG: MFS transporter [Succinivibrio sp.]
MKQDRAKLIANQLSFGILGAIEAAWAPMVPFVKGGMNLDDAQFGRLLLSMGVGSLCALPAVGPLISRFGPRIVAIAGCLSLGLSLVGISYTENQLLLCCILALFGASLIAIDVASNVNAVVLESIFKRPLMSGFHGGYSLGTIVGSMLMSLMLTVGFGIHLSSVILLVIMSTATFIGCKALISDVKTFNSEQVKEDEQKESGFAHFNIPPLVIVLGCLCFIMYGSEGALLSWTTVFATQNRGITPETAGYFYTFFAVTMTVARYSGNRLVSRIGRRRTVVFGAVMVASGFFVTAMVDHYSGMMIGFTIIGLGAGNIVPQLVSYTGTIRGIKVQSAISLINSLGYSGILLGPVIIGQISKMSSLERSFEVLGIAVFVVALVSFRILKNSRNS